eukprot:13120895-Ditylum_brightwellii.AAC.1
MTCPSFRNDHLLTVYCLPAGSCVIMTLSGYMDDEAWEEVVAILVPAIWKMPIIRNHPEWWQAMFYDGFKSH